MIFGIGNDIIRISKFDTISEHFIKRIYTEREVEAAKGRPSFYAGNFSVKESVAKAFGTGIRGFNLNDIEVLRDELGKPYVTLYNDAKRKSHELGINNIFVSISNYEDYVSTMAVAEK